MKSIQFTPDGLNAMQGNLVSHLGIEFLEVSSTKLVAKMPVDERTIQPLGLLHGGASVALAETLGSIGASLNVQENEFCVGLEINANHIKGMREGYVIGTAEPLHVGKKTQVWEIKITSSEEEGKLVCVSRITLSVLQKRE